MTASQAANPGRDANSVPVSTPALVQSSSDVSVLTIDTDHTSSVNGDLVRYAAATPPLLAPLSRDASSVDDKVSTDGSASGDAFQLNRASKRTSSGTLKALLPKDGGKEYSASEVWISPGACRMLIGAAFRAAEDKAEVRHGQDPKRLGKAIDRPAGIAGRRPLSVRVRPAHVSPLQQLVRAVSHVAHRPDHSSAAHPAPPAARSQQLDQLDPGLALRLAHLPAAVFGSRSADNVKTERSAKHDLSRASAIPRQLPQHARDAGHASPREQPFELQSPEPSGEGCHRQLAVHEQPQQLKQHEASTRFVCVRPTEKSGV